MKKALLLTVFALFLKSAAAQTLADFSGIEFRLTVGNSLLVGDPDYPDEFLGTAIPSLTDGQAYSYNMTISRQTETWHLTYWLLGVKYESPIYFTDALFQAVITIDGITYEAPSTEEKWGLPNDDASGYVFVGWTGSPGTLKINGVVAPNSSVMGKMDSVSTINFAVSGIYSLSNPDVLTIATLNQSMNDQFAAIPEPTLTSWIMAGFLVIVSIVTARRRILR